ncbi:MAG: hypothetical protein ACJA2S_005040, partial [Cyclobacteriaceae bacterium]
MSNSIHKKLFPSIFRGIATGLIVVFLLGCGTSVEQEESSG